MKTILLLLICFSLKTSYAKVEFTSTETISYLNKPYKQVKGFLLKKGYTFSKLDGEWYIFKKQKGENKYTVILVLKSEKVNSVSTQEFVNDYPVVIEDLQKNGFSFNKGGHVEYPTGEQTEFNEAPLEASASSLIRFNNHTKFMCFIVCPYNLYNGTKVFSVNYSNYSK